MKELSDTKPVEMRIQLDDNVAKDQVSQQEILNLVSHLLHSDDADPREGQTVYIAQEICDETGKIILDAVLANTSEVEAEDFVVLTPEFIEGKAIYQEKSDIP